MIETSQAPPTMEDISRAMDLAAMGRRAATPGMPKDRIEPMKWTNELFHQFRKYQQISQKLENFLQINIFSVFS